jgi:3-oxoacyl-[acyl-carrier protein] reductase
MSTPVQRNRNNIVPKLANRVALVTGGAGGLGSAICRALAVEGASVVVGFNQSMDAARTLAATLTSDLQPQHHTAMAAPVTDSAALKLLAQKIEQQYGRMDILVNSAGTTRFVAHGDLEALDDSLIDDILATNVRGPFAAARALRPLLAKNSAGLIVNISSIAAASATGSNVMYCASKAALDNMTKSLARALAPDIRVVSVSPGLVDTEFVKSLDIKWRHDQVARTPMARLATPAEVAQAVIAAATHFTFSTGTIFAVDGGRQLA